MSDQANQAPQTDASSVAASAFGPRWGDISIGGTWAEGIYNKRRTEISHHNGSGTICLVFGSRMRSSEENAEHVATALSDWDRGLLEKAEARVRKLEAENERLRTELLDANDNDWRPCSECARPFHIDETMPAVDDEGGECGRLCPPCYDTAPTYKQGARDVE